MAVVRPARSEPAYVHRRLLQGLARDVRPGSLRGGTAGRAGTSVSARRPRCGSVSGWRSCNGTASQPAGFARPTASCPWRWMPQCENGCRPRALVADTTGFRACRRPSPRSSPSPMSRSSSSEAPRRRQHTIRLSHPQATGGPRSVRRHPRQGDASAGSVEAPAHAGAVQWLPGPAGEHQRVGRGCDGDVQVMGQVREQTTRQGNVSHLVALGRADTACPIHLGQALGDDQSAAEHVDVSTTQRAGFPDPHRSALRSSDDGWRRGRGRTA